MCQLTLHGGKLMAPFDRRYTVRTVSWLRSLFLLFPSQCWWDLVWFEPGLNILSRSSFPSSFFPSPLLCKSLFFPLPPSFGLSYSLSCYAPLPSLLSLFKKERKKKEPEQPSSWAPYELLIPCSVRFILPVSTFSHDGQCTLLTGHHPLMSKLIIKPRSH